MVSEEDEIAMEGYYRSRYSPENLKLYYDGADPPNFIAIQAAFLAGIEHERNKSKWIACADKQPEKDGHYLVMRFENDHGSDVYYDAKRKGWNLNYGGDREHEMFPSHWMSLPTPPPPIEEKGE